MPSIISHGTQIKRFFYFIFILPLKEKKYLYFHYFFVWVYIVRLMNISLIWRRNYYRWNDDNVELCMALMPIKQWGFFCLSHLLCHRTSIYNCHLRGPMKLTPRVELKASLLFTQLINCTVARVYFQLKQMIYTDKRNCHCSILFVFLFNKPILCWVIVISIHQSINFHSRKYFLCFILSSISKNIDQYLTIHEWKCYKDGTKNLFCN